MKKTFIIIFFMLAILSVSSISMANAPEGHIYLPNGQTLDVRNLTEQEVQKALEVAAKSVNIEKSKEILESVKGINPKDLDEWRKVVTGTIKDVCNDLSITVNDFIKTPVGMWIAALITYKVMGKDLLENALDIIIMVPLWFMVSFTCAYLGWYFFSMKTIYHIKYDKDTGKRIEKTPERVERYSWESDSNREGLAWVLGIVFALITVVSLLLIL
jgi:hypothetical protein